MPRRLKFAEPVNNCGSCRFWVQGLAQGPLRDEGVCDRTKVQLEPQEAPLPRGISWYKHTTARALVARDPRKSGSDASLSFLLTRAVHSCSMWTARRGLRKRREKELPKERGPSLWKRLMRKGDTF